MARKTALVTIEAEGRDKGRSFLITEMPASQAERWATRALMAMAKSGVEIPDNIAGAGVAGLATLGLRAIAAMAFADAEPLLAEMMACAKYVPAGQTALLARPLIEDDIEEVATRVLLRQRIVELHTDFSFAGALGTTTVRIDSPPAVL